MSLMTDQTNIYKNLDMMLEYTSKSFEEVKSEKNKKESDSQEDREISTTHSITIEQEFSANGIENNK